MNEFWKILKGIFLYTLLTGLVLSLIVVFIFKPLYNDLTRESVLLYRDLIFYTLIGFSGFCFLLFFCMSFLFLGKGERLIFTGILLSFIFHVVYLLYAARFYKAVFIDESMPIPL